MDGLAKQAFDAFNAFPLVQVALAAAVFYAIWQSATRGMRDSGTKAETTPPWIMTGPLHDMMGAVHDVAEECRRTNDLLRDIRDTNAAILRQTEMNKATLEAVRNESRLR